MDIKHTNDWGAAQGWEVTNGDKVTYLATWRDNNGRVAVAEDASTVSFFPVTTEEEAIKRYMNPAVRPVKK